ncbi:thiamine biosynthesis protein ThiF [Lysinibacillus xylanilyticus]|uniref:ThiF family adenylyltransferase n=1 Tax=Lysinibacillus xylanilyticus TaxID=582475 RepID=UPI002B24F75E|nr:ThiF family adenylyltransferase [Lysinibacillus xylanilyticus]MEB2301616.1 thiamine biosynthesis protein ThiF [Lysinibacillus xylanilyticus]
MVQVGTGGNGGPLTQLISQVLSTQSHPDSVYVLADPDIVEEKNLFNQLFIMEDVGRSKAEVLAERYGQAYQLNVWSYVKGYIESVEQLESMYQHDLFNVLNSNNYKCVLIGCVDNNFSRKIMHDFFMKVPNLLYIDVGNESCDVPINWQHRQYSEWSKEEKDAFNESGWSGQVVCGLKKNGIVTYQPVAEVFPGILTDKDDMKPSDMSCADLAVSEPQRLITNRFAATAVLGVFQMYVLNNSIPNHIVHFHARKGYMRGRSQAICEI